jgi:creatinine amidohydrolase
MAESDRTPRNLGEMSHTDAARAAGDDAIVLLPVGVVEQHGPHLPLNADSLVADYLAQRVSERTGAIVAPVVNYGHSPLLQGYPGTISLRSETLRRLLADILSELVRNGFRRIVVINNHAGNEAAVTEAAVDLRARTGVVVGYVYPWAVGYALMRDRYDDPATAFGHGGEPEFSAMLAMFPELVQVEKAEAGGFVGVDGWKPRSYVEAEIPGHDLGGTVFWDAAAVNPVGVAGDVTLASADNGRIWLDRVLGYAVAYVEEYDRNTRRDP